MPSTCYVSWQSLGLLLHFLFAVSVDPMVQVYPLPAVVAGPSAPYAVITGGSSGIGREIANEVRYATETNNRVGRNSHTSRYSQCVANWIAWK